MANYPWYAVYVKPRHEKHVSGILRGKQYVEMLPLYTKRTRSRVTELPLFPGYVFCRFDAKDRLPILTVPGVVNIVSLAGTPVPVDESEMEALQRMIQYGLSREVWPSIPPGSRVTISRGPMKGVEGVVIKHRNGLRVIITVTLLQRNVAVELDRDWVDEEPKYLRAAV
jgi:transcription antitermination factor NusG